MYYFGATPSAPCTAVNYLHGARILTACFGLHNTETFMSEDLRLSRIPADAVMDSGR